MKIFQPEPLDQCEPGFVEPQPIGVENTRYLSVIPGPETLQVHHIVTGEMLVGHPQSLRQTEPGQELRPGRLRGEDLHGRAEDDVHHGDGHRGDWPRYSRA